MARKKILFIAFIVLGLHLLWAAGSTVRQYHAWDMHAFSRFFLTARGDEAAAPWTAPWNRLSDAIGGTPGGYFLYYAWGRFWLPALLFVIPPVALYAIVLLVGVLCQSEKKFFTGSGIVFLAAAAVSLIWRILFLV